MVSSSECAIDGCDNPVDSELGADYYCRNHWKFVKSRGVPVSNEQFEEMTKQLFDVQRDDYGAPAMPDKLEEMFNMQEAFMRHLQDRDGLEKMPEWPIDISQKASQKLCKSLAHDSMGELFEAVQVLKNSKSHRQTEITEFDRDHFVEELVDAFKYFLEILIFVGVSPEEFFESYQQKDLVNHRRIDDGY